jgi:hypothetical protein
VPRARVKFAERETNGGNRCAGGGLMRRSFGAKLILWMRVIDSRGAGFAVALIACGELVAQLNYFLVVNCASRWPDFH